MAINSKTIARNTLYLYFRFFLILIVNLYSSRIILDELGTTDYGLYNVVYSVVGFLSFLSSTLGSSTSRFITYELGAGDAKKLQMTYSTAWVSHIVLALIILVVSETFGLWYVTHIMVVPSDRYIAALLIFQISIFATIVSILQIPFTACIVAHESMQAYAYIGIFEALAKLGVALLLFVNIEEKLVYYSILTFLVSISVFFAYLFYSKHRFQEVSFKIIYEKTVLWRILKFSGWNILANLTNVLSYNVIILIFNLFFTPVVVTAHAIASQVSTGLTQLTANVRSAVNPQIIKSYAEGSKIESQKLSITSSVFMFDISIITCIPCILITPFLLRMWLVEVPDYAILFTQFMLIQAVLDTFNATYYAPLLAANKIAKNSLIGIFITSLNVGILYIVLCFNHGPEWARYLGLVFTTISSWLVKPYLIVSEVGYNKHEVVKSLLFCAKKLLIVGFIAYVIHIIMPVEDFFDNLYVLTVSFFSIGSCLYLMMPNNQKDIIKSFILSKTMSWIRK